MHIHVNTKHFQKYKQKLTKLHRSAFPTAIRNTLNDAAFDMKQNTLYTSASKNFKHTRSKSFFKSFSRVEKARGWDINKMQAITGLVDMGKATAKQAMENMEMHEKGGTVSEGSTYLANSRISKGFGRLVRKPNYFKKGSILKANKKATYIQKAFMAQKQGKLFIHNDFLIKVVSIKQSISKKKKTRKLKFNTQLITKKRDNVRIKPNHFITEAGQKTRAKIPKFHAKNTKKQIDKYSR